MTEAEWRIAASHPYYLMRAKQHVVRTSSRRKARLFAAACCRRGWPVLPPASRALLEVVEAAADSGDEAAASWGVFRRALVEQERVEKDDDGSLESYTARHLVGTVLRTAIFPGSVDELGEVLAGSDLLLAVSADADLGSGDAAAAQAAILGDVFGNPFRPVSFSPAWRTDTAVAVARQMYESRDFSAMPILADALQDAGCDSADVLDHCRDPNGVHVRGCWVVDLVLGKE